MIFPPCLSPSESFHWRSCWRDLPPCWKYKYYSKSKPPLLPSLPWKHIAINLIFHLRYMYCHHCHEQYYRCMASCIWVTSISTGPLASIWSTMFSQYQKIRRYDHYDPHNMRCYDMIWYDMESSDHLCLHLASVRRLLQHHVSQLKCFPLKIAQLAKFNWSLPSEFTGCSRRQML